LGLLHLITGSRKALLSFPIDSLKLFSEEQIQIFFSKELSSLVLSFHAEMTVKAGDTATHLLINNSWSAWEGEDLGLTDKLPCSPPLFVTNGLFMKRSQTAWGGLLRRAGPRKLQAAQPHLHP